MVSISFLYPKLLLFLFLIPVFVLIYFLSSLFKRKKAITFPNFEAMERISGTELFSKNFISLYINVAIIFLFVLGLSGAILHTTAETSSFSYVIAIDNSGSMKTSDIPPDRLEAAKVAASNFVDMLPAGVEVGVIEFSGDAKILQNLDTSKMRAKMAIDSVDFGDIPGTSMHNAIVVANGVFEDRRMKAVILISDGQLNVGDTDQIIRYATRNNIVIHSILAGTKAGGVTELNTVSKADEDVMKALSFNTEGNFFRVEDEKGFVESFNTLLKKSDREISIDISFYLLVSALILFFINWVLFNFRFRTLP
jgi:Ca-activated chloride channel family protein